MTSDGGRADLRRLSEEIRHLATAAAMAGNIVLADVMKGWSNRLEELEAALLAGADRQEEPKCCHAPALCIDAKAGAEWCDEVCQAVTGDRPAAEGSAITRATAPLVSHAAEGLEDAGERPAPDSKKIAHCLRELRGIARLLPEGYRKVYARLFDELETLVAGADRQETKQEKKYPPPRATPEDAQTTTEEGARCPACGALRAWSRDRGYVCCYMTCRAFNQGTSRSTPQDERDR